MMPYDNEEDFVKPTAAVIEADRARAALDDLWQSVPRHPHARLIALESRLAHFLTETLPYTTSSVTLVVETATRDVVLTGPLRLNCPESSIPVAREAIRVAEHDFDGRSARAADDSRERVVYALVLAPFAPSPVTSGGGCRRCSFVLPLGGA